MCTTNNWKVSFHVILQVWYALPFGCVFLAQTSTHSVTVPLQLHAVRKFIAVLKSCFALPSSLLKKNKKTNKPEKGFREVREFSSFLRNTKTNIFSISSYILFFTSLGWLAISHNNYFHYGKEVLLAVCHVFCFSECSWHCPLAYHY